MKLKEKIRRKEVLNKKGNYKEVYIWKKKYITQKH